MRMTTLAITGALIVGVTVPAAAAAKKGFVDSDIRHV
jgi:hypothetical protein